MSAERRAESPARSDAAAELVVVPDVGRDATVADVVRRALAGSVLRLLRHEPGVRLGADPEDVHQARVATRRLRSHLRTLRDVVEPEWAGGLRRELRWLGRNLGAVRDADVLRGRLRSRAASLPEADRPDVDALLVALDGQREQARERLLSSLREPRYPALRDALLEAARAPLVLGETAAAPAGPTLRPALSARWKGLARAIDVVIEDPGDEALHAARIRAKHARYAAEAVTPLFGKRAEAFAKAATALQDVLGEHQDAVVAGAWLRQAAGASPASAFVAGRLAELEAEAGRAAEAAWPRAWKTLSRKRLRFWS